MAAAVAGLGSIAGSMAAQKLMGDKKQPDTPQVDPTAAFAYYQMGSNAADYYTSLGTNMYSNAMSQARTDIINNYGSSIAQLQPEAQAGRAALDEMMRFVGLDPIPASANTLSQLKNMTNLGNAGSNLTGLIERAQTERDPTKRAELKQQVNAAFKSTQDFITQQSAADTASKLKAIRDPVATLGGQNFNTGATKGASIVGPTTYAKNAKTGVMEKKFDEQAFNAMVNAGNAQFAKEAAAANEARRQVEEEGKRQLTENLNQIQNFQNEFSNSYGDQYDAAYSGDQVSQKVQALPGYQNQLNSGTLAIERQGAARGMLGSGNTLLALQKFGQDLGLNFYQQNLANLAGIAEKGSAANQGISQLFANKGGALAQLGQSKGEGMLTAYSNIGKQYADAFYKAGDTAYDANKTNVGIMNGNAEAALNRQSSNTDAAIKAGPGYQSNKLEAGKSSGFGDYYAPKTSSNSGWGTWNSGTRTWQVNGVNI